jgi:D-glycero-alpha-D-manno-heptose-7-phosphate kinase
VFIGRSPLRISFAGGGTDLEEYHNKFDGYSISSTINKYTYIIAKLRNDDKLQGFSPDFASHLPPKKHHPKSVQGHEIVLVGLKEMNFKKGVDMYLATDVEPNSGLGASSSLTANFVNLIAYIQKKKMSKDKIAMKAYFIGHNVLKWGIGKQDEFAAVFGGFNLLKFTKNKVYVYPISVRKSTHKELQEKSLLFHLGNRKHSEGILKSQIADIKKSNKKTITSLHKAKELALDMRDALKMNDLTRFSQILKEGWEVKKNYTEGISNPKIEAVSKKAFSSGAIALKVTGAGGGGHLYVYAEPKKHSQIIKELTKIGVQKVNFQYENTGATVFTLNNL